MIHNRGATSYKMEYTLQNYKWSAPYGVVTQSTSQVRPIYRTQTPLIGGVKGSKRCWLEQPTMTNNTAPDNKYAANKRWDGDVSDYRKRTKSRDYAVAKPSLSDRDSIGTIGNGAANPKCGADISEDVTLTESETAAEAVTIPLADVGVAVPETATVDVRVTASGLAVDRRGETFEVERDGEGWALTGVVGRSELPERVPAWLEPVVEWFGVEEVRLGR